jgi:predicted peptidase
VTALALGACEGTIGDGANGASGVPGTGSGSPPASSGDAGGTPLDAASSCEGGAGCGSSTAPEDGGSHGSGDAGTRDAAEGGGGGGSDDPVQAPLQGNVTPGTWQAGDISVPGVTLPSGKPFHYDYLLPANYDPHFTYPILVHEHEDEEGDAWYDGQNGDPLYLVSGSGADGWYNNAEWRTAYPCIVILPYADQTANRTDGDDAVENFGGWTNTGVTGTGTTFSGDSGPNVFAVAGLVQHFIESYSVNSDKVYITGDSLGGIGSWYMILMYNRVNGPSGHLFTAALPFAGVMELDGFGSGPNASQIAQLANVPVFAVSGAQDGTSLPADWNQPLWRALAGSSDYPAPPSGAQAGSSSFHYMQDPGLGHDVWDTYRPLPAGKPMYDWLFSQ